MTSPLGAIQSYSLKEQDGYIFLPIGPKLLFCAVHNQGTLKRFKARNHIEQLQSLNKLTIRRAAEVVFARDERDLNEVRELMGARPGGKRCLND
ncbi:hypothetical protein BSY16_4063 (plasmid) [Sinorhizobium sp. RAC02]|nr:hypothetical protein BSY16_4063 [Sinorhizobium sp. RAC02]